MATGSPKVDDFGTRLQDQQAEQPAERPTGQRARNRRFWSGPNRAESPPPNSEPVAVAMAWAEIDRW